MFNEVRWFLTKEWPYNYRKSVFLSYTYGNIDRIFVLFKSYHNMITNTNNLIIFPLFIYLMHVLDPAKILTL